jgi:hypothetical protein
VLLHSLGWREGIVRLSVFFHNTVYVPHTFWSSFLFTWDFHLERMIEKEMWGKSEKHSQNQIREKEYLPLLVISPSQPLSLSLEN